MNPRIAIVGAGIYGCTAALHLAREKCHVDIFDPLGVLMGASSINQFRIHSGYHYPRSPETITEILETRAAFIHEYNDCIIPNGQHYYAIPKCGSRIHEDEYIKVMESFRLPLQEAKPKWLDFSYISSCWEVDESLYDADNLREIIKRRLTSENINFFRQPFNKKRHEQNYDYIIYATYGGASSWSNMFQNVRLEVAEKILIELPSTLKNISLVIVDGPFTAFDYYGTEGLSQFGSAKFTNHWQTNNPNDSIPDPYSKILNKKHYTPVNFTHFKQMANASSLAVPLSSEAVYMGSKFTLRMVEDSPSTDQRLLYIRKENNKVFHIFSGKVVAAVKAAKLLVAELCP